MSALEPEALTAPIPGEAGFEEAVLAAAEAQVPSQPPSDPQVAELEPEPVPEEIELAGVRIPAERAEALASFWQWSQDQTGQAWIRALDEAMRSGVDPVTLLESIRPREPTPLPPTPVPDEVPEDETYLDPDLKALRDELRSTKTDLDELRSTVTASQTATAQALINRAASDFGTNHDLSQDQVAALVSYMDRTTNLAGFATDTDGNPRDGLATLTAAMETAYWSVPEFRQRELDRVAGEQKKQLTKDRKLAAVGGTSGSVPHRPTPQSPEELENWAVEQISEAMGLK